MNSSLDPKTHTHLQTLNWKRKKKAKGTITNANKSMHKIYNYKIEIGRHSHEVNRPKRKHTHALNPSTKKKLKKTAKKER
jgi:hypothetical protein